MKCSDVIGRPGVVRSAVRNKSRQYAVGKKTSRQLKMSEPLIYLIPVITLIKTRMNHVGPNELGDIK
jgi:hypothetical protein